MTDSGTDHQSWWHYQVGGPIRACRLKIGDLKRLFDIIQSKQQDEGIRLLSLLQKLPQETDDQLAQRKTNVKNAFVTVVTIIEPNGRAVMSNKDTVFDSAVMPERIKSIFVSTETSPKTLLNFTPLNRINLTLDFDRPPLFNWALPSSPTPNGSRYDINAESEGWAAALDTRLKSFFDERATARNWIHKEGIYDALVMFVGIPLTLWLAYLTGLWIDQSVPGALLTAVYVYLFLAFLQIFRMLFSYTRWVFPLVELDGPQATWTQRHRAFWYLLITSISLGVITDLTTRVFD